MRIVVIDNYDSFTYNLVHALGVGGAEVVVLRNDAESPAQVLARSPDRIVISPGPGGPRAAGISLDLVRLAAGRVPLLGVCLGHQCLGAAYGGRVVRAAPVHGKTTEIQHDGRGVFRSLPNPLVVARYHSLVVDPASLAPELAITARSAEGLVMGLRHRERALAGVQFHPESFLMPHGRELLDNFLSTRFMNNPG